MIKANVIAIERSKDKEEISDMILFILKNNKYNVILIKNNRMSIKDELINNIDINIINASFVDTPRSRNILIIDNEENKKISEIILSNKIDLIVNSGPKENEKNHMKNRNSLYENLNKNGTVIANSDSKDIFEYFQDLKNNIIITYGLSPRATLTASSIDINLIEDNNEEICCNVCLQRGITTKGGNEIEPMEFPIKVLKERNVNHYNVLASIAVALVYDIPIKRIQESSSEYPADD